MLPTGCLVGGQQSVEITSCDQQFCTTQDGVCNNTARMCCCRAFDESIVQCDTVLETSGVANASVCGCSVCDDILVTVTATVRNAENDELISGAQIFNINDLSSPQFLGITFNGQAQFQVEFGLQPVTLQVVAANFRDTTRIVNLAPGRDITVTIPLTPLIVIVMGLGNSALTVRLGLISAVSAPANTFLAPDGVLYEGVVLFEGMFAGSDGNILAATDQAAQQFFLNNNTDETFVVFAVFFLGFRDTDGNLLNAGDNPLEFVISTEENGLFVAYFNSTDNTWEDGGDLEELSFDQARRKRQTGGITPVFSQSNVRIGTFAAVARRLNIECSLQARTFDQNGMPLPGAFITLEQRVGNLLFIFGTDTGTAQTVSDGLVSNAICLPLACDNFTSATLEAVDGSNILNPEDFPPGTFNFSENPPITIGDIFSIQEVVTATPTLRRSFYLGFSDCQASGQSATSPAADYFRFNGGLLEPFPEQNCYVKVQVLDCGDGGNVVTVRSVFANGSSLQTSGVAMDLTDMMMNDTFEFGSATTDMPTTTTTEEPVCDGSTATMRTVCVPFVCRTTIQIIVEPSPDSALTGTCTNTQRSVIVSLPELSEERTDQLIINTASLREDDYNDPDLGLYHDIMSPMIARGRCFAGNMTTADEIDFTTGIAGTFSCFQV